MGAPEVWPVQLPDEVALWPADSVALLRAEHAGRWELTSAWGEVGHRPTLPDGFPSSAWREVQGGWASPPHVRSREGRLLFPGGWDLPAPEEWSWTGSSSESSGDLRAEDLRRHRGLHRRPPHHSQAQTSAIDLEQAKCLEDLGYTVLRFGPPQLNLVADAGTTTDWAGTVQRYPALFGRGLQQPASGGTKGGGDGTGLRVGRGEG